MSTSGQRCVVAAYHDLGHASLESILRHGWEVAVVYTHEDDPHEEVWWRSVAALAREREIPVETADLNDDAQVARVRALQADWLFSIYYRRMLRKEVLDLFPDRAFNLHGSLLPKYRGRAPVNWAILSGEVETGVTLHHMTEKPDSGDIVDQEWVPIDEEDTARSVHQRLVEASVNVFDRSLDWLERGKAPRFPQDLAKGSCFGARTPEDGKIDFAWPAKRCFDLVRAVTHPYPGAFAVAGQQRYLVWDSRAVPKVQSGRSAEPGTVLLEGGVPHVACGAGFLVLERVTPPGAGEMTGAEASAKGLLPEGLRFAAAAQ